MVKYKSYTSTMSGPEEKELLFRDLLNRAIICLNNDDEMKNVRIISIKYDTQIDEKPSYYKKTVYLEVFYEVADNDGVIVISPV